MPSDKIIGIDLGTTNSAYAILEAGEPEIIPNSENDYTTPSVVGFTDDKKQLVGKPALNQAVQNPNRTIKSIKRKMGREDYTVEIGSEEFSPEEISAYILKKIKRDAEDYLNEEISRAVITVPAYFNDRQRQATKNAGEIAGLTVERILNEPTAAALAYGLDKKKDQIALIADLGGGTFDVSILDLGSGICDVIATNGERYLGGDDWDKVLVDYFASRFKEEHDVDLKNNPQAYQRLKREAEEIKKDLSTRHSATINLPFITTTEDGPLHLQDSITREKFEQISSGLRQKISKPIKEAIKDAHITRRDIDNLILVGGSTRMPQIEREIEGIIGRQPYSDINPEETVALGAAIQAGIINGQKDDVVLLDVTPMSLGIEIKGGLFEPLVEKNTTIPTRTSKLYTTAKDNQTTVDVNVFQGEENIAQENELLDNFTLENIPPADAGTPEITVSFRINANGIVEVDAKEKESGAEHSITIESDLGLNANEIDELKEKSEQIEEASKTEQERIKARHRADQIVSQAQQILTKSDTPIDPTTVIKIEDMINEIDEELNSKTPKTEKINRKTDKLARLLGEKTQKDVTISI